MTTQEITSTDLAYFGFRELHMAGNLLKAYASNGLDGFTHDEVRVMMNRNSGNVFLTNSDCQVAMMNGNDLELFYSCPECGHEGFIEDMRGDLHIENQSDTLKECQRYYREIKKNLVA